MEMSSPTPVVVSSVHYLPVGSVRSVITLNKSSSSAITLVTKKNVGTSNCHRRSSLSLQQQQLSSSMSHDNNQHATHRRRMRYNVDSTSQHIDFMAMTKKNHAASSSQASVAMLSYHRCRNNSRMNVNYGDDNDANDSGEKKTFADT
jgi:hypothetical protein